MDNLESEGVYKLYLIMNYFDLVLIPELRSQEVSIYDNVDVNEKEPR